MRRSFGYGNCTSFTGHVPAAPSTWRAKSGLAPRAKPAPDVFPPAKPWRPSFQARPTRGSPSRLTSTRTNNDTSWSMAPPARTALLDLRVPANWAPDLLARASPGRPPRASTRCRSPWSVRWEIRPGAFRAALPPSASLAGAWARWCRRGADRPSLSLPLSRFDRRAGPVQRDGRGARAGFSYTPPTPWSSEPPARTTNLAPPPLTSTHYPKHHRPPLRPTVTEWGSNKHRRGGCSTWLVGSFLRPGPARAPNYACLKAGARPFGRNRRRKRGRPSGSAQARALATGERGGPRRLAPALVPPPGPVPAAQETLGAGALSTRPAGGDPCRRPGSRLKYLGPLNNPLGH